MQGRLRRGCVGVFLVALANLVSFASKRDQPPEPPPALRLLTQPLGYYPISSFYLMGRTSSVSLDFIDQDHLLFTFRVPGLLKRLPDCKPDDEDQVIRALVLHLPDGAIERSSDWRMHDRGRYLWPLHNGKFLVRQRDTLFATDALLELQPYLQSQTPIRLVKLSPDARLLLVESDLEKHSEEQHKELVSSAALQGLSAPREDVQMTVLRAGDRTAIGRSRVLNPVDLPLLGDGFLETLSAQGNHWMVRYKPFSGEESVVANVASNCRPNEIPLTGKTFLLSVCPNESTNHLFEAISLSGKQLWSYKWDSHFIWPTMAVAETGQRVAFSTLRVARALSTIDPFDESEVQAQRIEVLDVDTGRLELTEFATPILSGGQNYALSADGTRFAVLRDNAIEIHELPAPPGGSSVTRAE
jgi:hypothetical protein